MRVDLANRVSGLHRNSPQGLNIYSIRVFDQTKDPEIPIIFPPIIIIDYVYNLIFNNILLSNEQVYNSTFQNLKQHNIHTKFCLNWIMGHTIC